ncbi:MAG: hypothetical protein QOF44_3154, partial [Streptomyces sp.]|nr:hypothetical protein [Streptomyces sp.]
VAMTSTASTAPPALNPQIVGQAEKAHQPVLDRILARTGTTMTPWVALKFTAVGGGEGSSRRLGFTDAGEAFFQQISSAVDDVVTRVYADIPAADLATAGRVLTLITSRLDSARA